MPGNLSVAGHFTGLAAIAGVTVDCYSRLGFGLVEVLAGKIFVEAVNVVAEVRVAIGISPGGEIH